MSSIYIRNALITDIPFLTDAVIAAEKSGTEILSYSTMFGLSEQESRNYISEMFEEEIDGCELSISSYLVAEQHNQLVAAVGAWIEGYDGMSSGILKGNLLNFTLPRHCIEKASALNYISKELSLEYINNTIQIGIVYVHEKARGLGLANLLIVEQINKLKIISPEVAEAYLHVFGNNTTAIRAYEKLNYNRVTERVSSLKEIKDYLPYDSKMSMVKKLN
jgi:ribosomal protein S18 acetylase RimI-like enzyme